ncbi:MAG TPA: SH3 domain-containing protein [Anaerolineales bacterium]|nr:SH3 domain-containing protein [Anaerolineales bacterium]
MKRQIVSRSNWANSAILLIIFALVGCTGQVAAPTLPPAPSSTAAASSPTEVSVDSTATSLPVTDENILYQDDFTNPATGWSVDQFDNYFVGYHEPEYYHIEISSPNYKAPIIVEPEKRIFDDGTIELQVFTNSGKTAPEGDFRYGLVFRRSGDQYYAFTISQRTKKWYFLKNSPTGLEVLKEGTEGSIHDLDVDDVLRVDAQGPNFFFHVNDNLIDQVNDSAYASGEVGFYVESFDSPNTHIHFDNLVIRNLEMPETAAAGSAVIYQDDFTNPATSWPDRKFDNYFIGYHEPEYYHVEVTGANYKTAVFEPEKRSFADFTMELQVLTVSARTAPEGDFRYGLAFRRSGDQYYAFTVSPRTKKWFALKSSPSGLEVLQEGVAESIQDLDLNDLLRVDAQGSNLFFHINDQLVGQVTDSDYASGEVGFYVESFDSPNTHIHFDTFAIRDLELSLVCTVVNEGTLNVRSGPSRTSPQIAVLSNGDTVEAEGISPDGAWIKISMEGSEDPGWVGYTEGFLSCTPGIDLFPIVNP